MILFKCSGRSGIKREEQRSNYMAQISVKVPVSGNNAEIEGWIYDVSQHINASDTVKFVDATTGIDCNVGRIHANVTCTVSLRDKNSLPANALSFVLVGSMFHEVAIGGIENGTSVNAGIHVKI